MAISAQLGYHGEPRSEDDLQAPTAGPARWSVPADPPPEPIAPALGGCPEVTLTLRRLPGFLVFEARNRMCSGAAMLERRRALDMVQIATSQGQRRLLGNSSNRSTQQATRGSARPGNDH